MNAEHILISELAYHSSSQVSDIKLTANLRNLLDELDFAEFMMSVQDELGIDFPDDQCDSYSSTFVTLKDVLSYVQKHPV
jgi:acyl carrier protein